MSHTPQQGFVKSSLSAGAEVAHAVNQTAQLINYNLAEALAEAKTDLAIAEHREAQRLAAFILANPTP